MPDPANLFETEAELRGGAVTDEAIELLADRIVLAHAKDRQADGRVAAAGTGIVDFPRVLARLRRAGFEGSVVAHGLSAEEAPAVAGFLRDCLEREA